MKSVRISPFSKGQCLLTPENVLPGLKTKVIGKKILHVDVLDSTQNLAGELARKGEPEGTLVLAESQTMGRGRQGSPWVSKNGGIWGTLILRPEMTPDSLTPLSQIASQTVSDAIKKCCGLTCILKEPNDILTPSGKKVCGIMIESSSQTGKLDWVLLGFGINVNNPAPEGMKIAATSLKEELGRKVDRVKLIQSVLEEIEKQYDIFLNKIC